MYEETKEVCQERKWRFMVSAYPHWSRDRRGGMYVMLAIINALSLPVQVIKAIQLRHRKSRVEMVDVMHRVLALAAVLPFRLHHVLKVRQLDQISLVFL